MNIRIWQGRERPPGSWDCVVVIDVLRAFSVTHALFSAGVREIIAVASAEEAFALRDRYPAAPLIGEVDGYKIAGFDFGNSPTDVASLPPTETAVLRTTNGVAAVISACAVSEHVLAASFLNIGAVYNHLQAQPRIDSLCLVASHPSSDEDVACANWLKDSLTAGAPADYAPYVARIAASECAARFLDPAQPEFPQTDLEYASQTGGSFVMRVYNEANFVIRGIQNAPC